MRTDASAADAFVIERPAKLLAEPGSLEELDPEPLSILLMPKAHLSNIGLEPKLLLGLGSG